MPNKTYKIKEVAELLSVSTPTVRGWLDSGKLRGINVSPGSLRARWRVTDEELSRFMQQQQN